MEEIKEDNNCIIKAFENNPISILHEEIDGKKIFCFKASDIGKALNIVNIRTSIMNFDEDEKVVRTTYSSNSGNPETIFLTSQGVYRLLYNSKKPEAKKFRKWAGNILDDIIFNESTKLKKQLEQQELEKSKLIEENKSLKKKKLEKFLKKEALYIASDNDNRCVIGISNNMQYRERAYIIHNPSFQIDSVYYCRDYKLIE